jgi:hypothetical protein
MTVFRKVTLPVSGRAFISSMCHHEPIKWPDSPNFLLKSCTLLYRQSLLQVLSKSVTRQSIGRSSEAAKIRQGEDGIVNSMQILNKP